MKNPGPSGRRTRSAARPKPILGWREWVTLPDVCPTPMKAKVDTGALTSALHAFDLKVETAPDGQTVASFEIHPVQRSAEAANRVELPVVDLKTVRSSNGRSETRPVVRTEVLIGSHRWTVDLTLTRRDEMGFRMLLGRAAVRRRFLVDPGKSFQQGGRPD